MGRDGNPGKSTIPYTVRSIPLIMHSISFIMITKDLEWAMSDAWIKEIFLLMD